MLEGWYPSRLNFWKFIEYHENSIEDVILTLSKCEDFYSNKVLEFIKEKRTREYLFYFEIDADFNCNFYRYAINFNTRPIMENEILNDYQILIQSSKACTGVPYSFMKSITLQDYKTALLQNYNELKTATYNIS